MLLGREKSLCRKNKSSSVEKNKSLIKVASSSKIPKGFFRQEIYENKSAPSCPLEFTFMNPLTNNHSVKLLKKGSHELKIKQCSLKLKEGNNSKVVSKF